ncbi:MAG: hypothetical protein H0T76_25275 [Nannocystis sp.]|nr:hypothetical protein [Nannocystis sp.]MBA3549806.1 hypothetical protein [Nannocystis sp.]
MRDFIPACTIITTMRPISATILVLAVGCHSPTYLAITAAHDAYDSATTGDVDPTTEAAASGTTDAGGESLGESTNVGTDTGDADDASGPGDAGVSATEDTGTAGEETGDTDTGEPAALPSILSLSLPAKVYAAGPVKIEVLTEHTLSVQIEVDGVDLGELADAGDGLFIGVLPVRGAIDNGLHEVKVIAKQGPHEVDQTAGYEVSTPKPGTMAWLTAGPAGSRTNRLALTAEDDVLEGGQIEINKVTRPSLRKRSALTGAELFSKPLDTREGSVADLAVRPDGRVWVAMNVRKQGEPSPRPRIALFEADGTFTGIEAFGDLGQGVRAIAADAEGGCFATGFASAGKDLDIGRWRIDDAGVQTLGDPYDYAPKEMEKHSFSEFASDVVIIGDVAWVVGASDGLHDGPFLLETRGILVPMDLHTGEILDPVIVAGPKGTFTQNVFFGASPHPDGLLVTGYGCNDTCTEYRIETTLYDLQSGMLLWFAYEVPSGLKLQYGSDIVLDSQGRALVAGVVTENGALRGYVFARPVYGNSGSPALFDHWFPAFAPSAVLGIVVDTYDRISPAGYITVNGSIQARLVRING